MRDWRRGRGWGALWDTVGYWGHHGGLEALQQARETPGNRTALWWFSGMVETEHYEGLWGQLTWLNQQVMLNHFYLDHLASAFGGIAFP